MSLKSENLHNLLLQTSQQALHEYLRAAKAAELPKLETFLPTRFRQPVQCCELVAHVANLSHKLSDWLSNLAFDGTIIVLGRDATPVALGVSWLNKEQGQDIHLRMMDVSNKYFFSGWNAQSGSGDTAFISRLLNGDVSKEEAVNSGFWRFFKQNELNSQAKILLVDNGLNGTLLARINLLMHLCSPDIEVHNALLYYSGAVKLPNVSVIVRKQPEITGQVTEAHLLEVAEFSRENVRIEAWPHPYASLSHFEITDEQVFPKYVPSRIVTTEGLVEAEINWAERGVLNLQLLAMLKNQISS